MEVTKANNLVPEEYERKQTLVNGKRYIIEELKQLENTYWCREQVVQREYDLFCQIRDTVAGHVVRPKTTSDCISTLDALCSFGNCR